MILLSLGSLVVVAVMLLLFFRAVEHSDRVGMESRLLAATDDCESFSVICRGLVQCAYLRALLSQDWARFELLFVGDSATNPKLFADLISEYAMCEVEYGNFSDLNVFGVRALYRSRYRLYRRLVIIDRAQSRPIDDLNAAAAIASGNWLVPISKGVLLQRDAFSALSLEIESFTEPVVRLRTTLGEPQEIISTDHLSLLGGFGSGGRVGRAKVVDILLCYPGKERVSMVAWLWLVVLLLLFILLSVLAEGWWGVLFALLTLGSLALLVECGRVIDPAGRRCAVFVYMREKSWRKIFNPINIV